MSRIRLYLDEDTIKAALIQALRSADLDVVTVADVNRLGYSDEDQLLWAIEQGRIIYSFNIGDFCHLHRDFMVQEISHAGIILVPQQKYSIGQQLQGLLKLVSQYSAEDMINQLLFLSYYIEQK
ncbi:hypothetical protein PCC7805_01480 [Planktothrix agardhii]|uniref:DUF5615 domain-containing protein n=2 Tax=Planktothrix agardhii TaxID=1160 RepID=A0A073CPD7_PLAA1|nr:DUF5615 family PIN-like protein [Planktothrix agardhii]MCF3608216.1 DUF5615 family PIN-like protein [Planktothrix agardhii 1033]BBD54752.1 hypothetical protein NIES204_20480 [Planktothrix agardhii NIES-204]KEI65835.1 hypothetical protein A19Y_0663 [Planktothrix agardhii NIVA-CYA 126/8]MCB8752322.1 DUF5615 family PIN-like protein [Planktothrix agardhii 1810]MCB8761360.1 DUF5615 family PIN-like protein [Planktothrix agardhii 1813]